MAVAIKCVLPRVHLVPSAVLKPSKFTPSLINNAKTKNTQGFRSEWVGMIHKEQKREILELTFMGDQELKLVMRQILFEKYANDLNFDEFKHELIDYYVEHGNVNSDCTDVNIKQLDLMLILFSHRHGSEHKSGIAIHIDVLQYYAMHHMYDLFKQAYMAFLQSYYQKDYLNYLYNADEKKVQEAMNFFNPYGHE